MWWTTGGSTPFVLMLAGLCLGGAREGRGQPQYTAQPIGTLGTSSSGYGSSNLQAVSDTGVAVGNSQKYDANGNYQGSRGVVYQNGTLTDIGTLGTNSSSIGSSSLEAVSDAGVAVGASAKYDGAGNFQGYRGVVYDNGTLVAIELGTNANGYSSSSLWAVSNTGVAVGGSEKYDGGNYQGYRGVVYQNGTLTDIGTLGTNSSGYGYSYLQAVSDTGVAVGGSDKFDGAGNPQGGRGVVYDNGTLTDIGTLGTNSSGYGYSYLQAVSDTGVAVGYSRKYDGGVDKGYRGVVYQNGTLTDIGTLGTNSSGYGHSYLQAVSDTGVAVGGSDKFDGAGNPQGGRGVVYDNGTLTDIGTLGTNSSGYGYSYLQAVSDTGVAIGESVKYDGGVDKGFRGVVYDNGTLVAVELGTDANGYSSSSLQAVSDTGVAVGTSVKYDSNGNYQGDRAVAYFSGYGVVDLNDLLQNQLPAGLVLISATGVNDAGYIVATGYNSQTGAYEGVLLSPFQQPTNLVPEPTSLAMIGTAVGGLGLFRGRRRKVASTDGGTAA